METPLPRYLEIQRDLQQRIASGDWSPGARIPAEHELQTHYQCSRMTVNKAMSALANAGLIIRKRRAGSFVASPKNEQAILEIHDIKAEVLASGRLYRFEILARAERAMTERDGARFGMAPIGRVLALTALHHAGPLPYALEERLINLETVPSASAQSFSAAPPGTWLLELIPWTSAEHVIRAEAASAAMRRWLRVPRNAACLSVERRTWQGSDPITYAKLSYPGERHHLTSRFSPHDRL